MSDSQLQERNLVILWRLILFRGHRNDHLLAPATGDQYRHPAWQMVNQFQNSSAGQDGR